MTFAEQLGLEHPIVQAGMGGGIASGELAGAVSAAGGLGTVGILPPDRLARDLERAREIAGAGRPVALNLLVPFTTGGHIAVVTRARPSLVVLHAGFSRTLIDQLRGSGTIVLHTVGTAGHARRALADGADGLVAQGVEAGGHLVGIEPALTTLERIRDVAGGRPVLLAGGIADAGDVRMALGAGADAVVAGTRFLLTHESAAHPEYKRAVLEADRTLETQLFGLGWPMRHRVVPNAATDRWCRAEGREPHALRTLYPLTTPLTRLPMRVVSSSITVQHPAIPLFSPSPPVMGMPARVVQASALYAGETALRIDGIVGAADAVALLAA